MLPRNLLVIFFSCLTLTTLTAQESGDDGPIDPLELPGLPAAEEGDIECRCVSTFQPGKNDVYYFKIDGIYHQVSLVGEAISPPFPVRGSTTFTLYKKNPAAKDSSEKEQPLYIPAVQQVLKGGGNEFIIVLSRKDGKSPLKSRSINISKANCPADNVHLYNESPVALGLQINESEATVQAFKNFRYNFSNTTRDTYTSAKIVMRYQGEKKIMASKRLRLVPGRRMILICFPSKSRVALGATPLHLVTYQDKP